MDRLKEARPRPFRIDVGTGRDRDGAGDGRPQVRKDVAKQIARDHNVEFFWETHEMGGEDIDMEFVDPHLRELTRHGLDALIPPGH